MKCPKCGFTSYDHLENCKRCNAALNPKVFYSHPTISHEKKSEEHGADHSWSAPDLNAEDLFYEFKSKESSPENYPSEDESGFLTNHDRFQNVFDKLEKVNTGEMDHSRDTLILENRYGFAERVKDFFCRWFSASDIITDDDKTAVSHDLAGIWSRLGAFLIDWTIVIMLSTAVFIAGLRQVDIDYTYNPGALFSILVKVYLLLLFFASSYFLFLTYYSGKTIGKLLFGIEVVNRSGDRPGYFDCARRWFFSIISMLPFFAGYVIAIFSEERQGFHDRIADTVVVNTGTNNDYRSA